LEPEEADRAFRPTAAHATTVAPAAEDVVLAAARRRALLAASEGLPGRCPELLRALLESPAPRYREIAAELDLPRGSIGPLRSRCLSCLGRALRASGWSPADLR
jgi:DNA-directed RNA polymerase specialized sigma24 family protein